MYAELPHLKILTKSVCSCELLVSASVDINKLCNWLHANQANEIECLEKGTRNETFWIINFCTSDERLIAQLQNRCIEKAQESLKQKDQRIEEFIRQLEEQREGLVRQLEGRGEEIKALQLNAKKQSKTLIPLTTELEKLRSEYQSLQNAYQPLSTELAEERKRNRRLEEEVSRLKKAVSRNQNNHSEEVPDPVVPLDVCIICGKPAMWRQGMCLDCSR